MKVVVDTNVLISAIFFKGEPQKVLELIAEDKITAFASLEIIEEYTRVIYHISKKLDKNFDKNVMDFLFKKMTIIVPDSKSKCCRDPDDDKFINCALSAKAKYLISGDSDLLVLEKINFVNILKVKEFLDIWFSKGR